MKKIKVVSLILAAILLLGCFTACGSGDFNLPTGDTIKVKVAVYDDPRVTDPENKADFTEDDIEYIIEETEIETDYASVLGVMKQTLENAGLDFEIDEDGSTFSYIGTRNECEPGVADPKYGYCWSFKVSGKAGRIAEKTAVKDGDKIEFFYDCYTSGEDETSAE